MRELSVKKQNVLVISILFISLITLITNAVAPILPTISDLFPDASELRIQMIVTIPSLVGVPVQLIVGALSMKVDIKPMTVFGVALIGIGGLLPLLIVDNLSILHVSAALSGVGLGILSPLAAAFVVLFFKGERQAFWLGASSTAVNIGAIIFPLVTAFLSDFGYQYVFLMFAVCLPAVLLCWVGLPKAPPMQSSNEPVSFKFRLPWKAWLFSLIGSFYWLFNYTFITNVPKLIKESAIGDTKTIGTIMSINAVAACISGLLFSSYRKKLKHFSAPVALALSGIGAAVLHTANSLSLMIVGSILMGLSISLIQPWVFEQVGASVGPKAATLGISIYMSMYSIAQFLTPIVMISLSDYLFDGSASARFLIASAGLICTAVVAFVFRKHLE